MNNSKSLPFVEFVALTALLTSLAAMSTDAMLPALAQIGADLGVKDANEPQLIISAMFGGFAIGQIFYGPLSDFIGRRPAIILALAIFIAGSLISVASSSFDALLFSRFLQGLGAAGPKIIAVALIRDTCEGRAMARVMSFVATVFIIVPVLAPNIGGLVMKFSNWRSIFLLLAAMGTLCLAWFYARQSETLPPDKRQKFSKERVRADILQVVTNRRVMGYTAVMGLVFGIFLSYLNAAQQIFETNYKAGELFPIYFAINALSLGTASIINAKLVMKLGMRFLSLRAMIIFCVVSAVFLPLCLYFNGTPPLWTFMAFCMSSFFCTSVLFGNLNAMTMEPMGHIAGMAAALTGCFSTLIALPIGTLIGQLYDGTLIPMTASFLIVGLLALMLLLKISKEGF
jgi:drug resistance transporter, bcr/cflA subfamily